MLERFFLWLAFKCRSTKAIWVKSGNGRILIERGHDGRWRDRWNGEVIAWDKNLAGAAGAGDTYPPGGPRAVSAIDEAAKAAMVFDLDANKKSAAAAFGVALKQQREHKEHGA